MLLGLDRYLMHSHHSSITPSTTLVGKHLGQEHLGSRSRPRRQAVLPGGEAVREGQGRTRKGNHRERKKKTKKKTQTCVGHA